MSKIHGKSAHGLGVRNDETDMFRKNHFASKEKVAANVQAFLEEYSMTRVAGNVYECPSTKDFWKVQGNKIVKLVGNEVNNGESIPAAPEDKPAAFLAHILDDLEF